MPQRPVRISWGSSLREQESRDNANMDLFVAKTQERGNQTPTLSGKTIKGKRRKDHQKWNTLMVPTWNKERELASGFWRYYPITRGCHSKNRNTTSASLWVEDERTVVHKSLGLDATPIEKRIMLAEVVHIPGRTLLIKAEECLERWGLEKSNTQVCYEIESWVRGGSWETRENDFIRLTRTQTQTMAHSILHGHTNYQRTADSKDFGNAIPCQRWHGYQNKLSSFLDIDAVDKVWGLRIWWLGLLSGRVSAWCWAAGELRYLGSPLRFSPLQQLTPPWQIDNTLCLLPGRHNNRLGTNSAGQDVFPGINNIS